MKIFYFFCFILSACNYHPNDKTAANTKKVSLPPADKLGHGNIDSNAKVTYQIINSTGNSFGYEIFIDKKRFIHQTVVPATSGNKGFKSKRDAQKVAELVSRKIIHGEMPPAISLEEIHKLNLSTEIN
jgi:hypothetical protein